jgi:hypothetical protein
LYENRSSCGCSGDDCLWPKPFRQDIPFDVDAKRLVILECDNVIFEVDIPDPPKVELTCKSADDPDIDYVGCNWNATREGHQDLWYLLQWRDRRGVWRGVAPRTQRTEWKVPKSFWARDREMSLRVLATSGIATGLGTCTGKLVHRQDKTPGPRPVDIQLIGVEAAEGATVELAPTVRVAVTTATGGTLATGQILWHGADGGLIGRGRSLLLSNLPVGVHVVHASVLNEGDGEGTRAWIFERTRDGRYLWHRGTITYPEPEDPSHAVEASRDHTRSR